MEEEWTSSPGGRTEHGEAIRDEVLTLVSVWQRTSPGSLANPQKLLNVASLTPSMKWQWDRFAGLPHSCPGLNKCQELSFPASQVTIPPMSAPWNIQKLNYRSLRDNSVVLSTCFVVQVQSTALHGPLSTHRKYIPEQTVRSISPCTTRCGFQNKPKIIVLDCANIQTRNYSQSSICPPQSYQQATKIVLSYQRICTCERTLKCQLSKQSHLKNSWDELSLFFRLKESKRKMLEIWFYFHENGMFLLLQHLLFTSSILTL